MTRFTRRLMPKRYLARAGATLLGTSLLWAGTAGPAAAYKVVLHEDDSSEIRLRGRIQYDMLASSDQPEAREDSATVRRARVGLRFRWAEDWRAALSFDFNEDGELGGGDLRDGSIEYRGWPLWVEFGRMQEPFGLTEQASSRDLVLLERPQPTAIGPDYNFGIAGNLRGDLWGLNAGVFFATGSEQLSGNNPESALTLRGHYTPLREKAAFIHVGASASFRRPDEDTLRVTTRPETVLVSGLNASSPRFTGVSSYQIYGIDAAFRSGPLLVTSEVLLSPVSGDNQEASLTGAYLEAAYTLTDERRGYSTRRGTFGGINPRRPLHKGGCGAFELSGRISTTDLEGDQTDATAGTAINGESGSAVGVGLNWYPHKHFKLMLNALRVNEDSAGSAEEDATIWQLRLQAHL